MHSKNRRFSRAQTIIEALVAIVVLTIAFLAFSQGMIVATQAGNKASNHTQAIEMANFLLEWMRNDPAFWTNAEMTGGAGICPTGSSTTPGNCWTTNVTNAPDKSALPPYSDDMSKPITMTNSHPGFCGFASGCNPVVPYRFLWRADVHGAGQANPPYDGNLADLTVEVIVNVSGRQEIYKVSGVAHNPAVN